MIDQTWSISDEIVDPSLAHLRVLLEMYADPSDQNQVDGVTLANFQEYSVNKAIQDMVEFGGSLLVSPTGTGKTMMGSIIARRMQQLKKISRVFVVAPNQQILDKWGDVF